MKNDKTFIDLAHELERSLSRLYGVFSIYLQEDRNFWKQMSREELNHAKLVQKAARFFSKSKIIAQSNLALLQRFENLINHIKDYEATVQYTSFTRKDALEKALEFENTALETHFHDVFQSLETQTDNDLFQRLQQQDKMHIEQLIQHIKNQ